MSAAVAVVVFTRRWHQWALQLVDVFPQSKLTPGIHNRGTVTNSLSESLYHAQRGHNDDGKLTRS